MALQDVLNRTLCALAEFLVVAANSHVRYYFTKSVAGICSVIMGFRLEKCVLAECLTDVSAHSIEVQQSS